MITYRQATKLLAPGETVYTSDGKQVVECVVAQQNWNEKVKDNG